MSYLIGTWIKIWMTIMIESILPLKQRPQIADAVKLKNQNHYAIMQP